MSQADESTGLWLPQNEREELWAQVARELEAYARALPTLRVAPAASRAEVRAALEGYDFARPRPAAEVVRDTAALLRQHLLHTAHPAYFGVFNPAASTMGVAADALVAGFNPQLASSASASVAIEIESRLVRWFGTRFGYPAESVDGTFTPGGTLANLTALACALASGLPGWAAGGVASTRPVIYVSTETHHSIQRAARVLGLGTGAVVALPVDEELALDVSALEARVDSDRAAGRTPLAVVATLGTTSAGTFDGVARVADAAARHGLWLHADAAWGGAAILLPEHAALFDGVARADSITLDAHKWLSVPMGAGLLMTRHPGLLEETFRVEASPYMPGHTWDSLDAEPYKQSLEWSRRFAGLKLWMTLAVHGEEGYRSVLRHQVAMGDYLRARLHETGWRVVNRTPLPVACFVDPADPALDPVAFARRVGETGATWITPTKLTHDGTPVLRAGISNFATKREHVDVLIATLERVRASNST